MKQSKIIEAYKVLQKISDMSIDYNTAYQIFRLKNKLKEIFDFQVEEEQKLIKECNAAVINGSVSFNNEQDAEVFYKKIKELNDKEHDLTVDKVDISDEKGLKLSINDIEKLDDFIIFRKE